MSGVWTAWRQKQTLFFSPKTPELAIDAPAPDVSVDAFSPILDAFVAKVEAACGRIGARKCPLPPPSAGDNSDALPGPARTHDPGPEVSEDADQEPS